MLEDELSVLIYMFTYPVACVFNVFMDFIGVFLAVFLNLFVCVVEMINAFNSALYNLVSIALPAQMATLVLIMFYILGLYYIIKLIKTIWDVLPFV